MDLGTFAILLGHCPDFMRSPEHLESMETTLSSVGNIHREGKSRSYLDGSSYSRHTGIGNTSLKCSRGIVKPRLDPIDCEHPTSWVPSIHGILLDIKSGFHSEDIVMVEDLSGLCAREWDSSRMILFCNGGWHWGA
ncbi:hypothetical protein B0H11DRAFT_1938036 [Mycena galericulata]|nr:hypothetical protein B0H11DRAFT_1938036 [Mycena galericulata]